MRLKILVNLKTGQPRERPSDASSQVQALGRRLVEYMKSNAIIEL